MAHTVEAVIGVDVGDTNTDAVILQTDSRQPHVLSTAKTITSSDVTSGVKYVIALAINNREKNHDMEVQRVNVGTKQFINAIIQRKGLSKIIVIRLCGNASRSLPPYSDFPADLASRINGGTYLVNGGYEVDGREIAPVAEDEIHRVIADAKNKGIFQFVICGIYCSLNNDQELLVKSLVKKGIPEASVTLSHEIGQVGLIERENAAILNETMKPLFRKILLDLKTALREMGLLCPLYITQNDGTLVNVGSAFEHPIRTFESGFTNSMIGAAFLSGKDDAIVVDIGGITTHAGMLFKGRPRCGFKEATIGNVRTNFQMPDLFSIVLGGGSYFKSNQNDQCSVSLGPQSAGCNIRKEAFIFQDDASSCHIDHLTATDLAVAAGHLKLGNTKNVSNLPRQLVEAGTKKLKEMVETAIDNTKLSADPLPVVIVGGGAVILDIHNELQGVSDIFCPDHFDVANAVGAAVCLLPEKGTANVVEDYTIERIDTLNVTRNDIENNCTGQMMNVRANIENTSSNEKQTDVQKISETPIQHLYIETKTTREDVQDVISEKDSTVVIPKDFVLLEAKYLTDSNEDIHEITGFIDSEQKTHNLNEKPFLNDHSEWILSEYDIECIGLGAGIFGCGGGGSPVMAKLLAKRALREGKIMKVVNPYSFLSNKDNNKDLVVTTAFMGAPSVISEKMINIEEITALQCMKDVYSVGHYQDGNLSFSEGVKIHKEDGIEFIDDYQLYELDNKTAKPTSGEENKIVGLMSAEIAGLNAIVPLLVGAELGLPVLDCDGMGRAFPELQMLCPLIYGAKSYPATLADDKGRRAVVLQVDSAKRLEQHFRKVTVEMGSTSGLTILPLTKDEIINKTVLFSISRAWRLGHAIISSRKCKIDPVQAAMQQEGGIKLISGKITEVRRETVEGFNKGYIYITDNKSSSAQHLVIEFQNENLIARKITASKPDTFDLVACTPDLITIVDTNTCEPFTTEMIRYGLNVSVLVLPIPDVMRTPTALNVVGPKGFGYSDEVKYSPVGSFKIPIPIAP